MTEKIEIVIICIGVLIGFCYFLLILLYAYGWIKTPAVKIDSSVNFPKVSVIVAARNEADSIEKCIQALLKQSYNKQLFEIIVVDDHSTDNTYAVVADNAVKENQIIVTKLSDENSGKKNAIKHGIAIAKGDVIVTTDADCIMGTHWIETLVSCLIKSNSRMVVGPVDYYEEKTLLEKFQSLELIALIASGAGALHFNKAIMCNGANLAYYKKTFLDVGGYKGLEPIASGDDVLLMYKIDKMFPGEIAFVKSEEAMVYTKAKVTLREFYQQRKRWASKGFRVLNNDTKLAASVVLAFNTWIVMMMTISAVSITGISISNYFISSSFLLLGIKWLIDFLLLFLATAFFNKRKLLVYFILEQLFYSFYIFIVGLFGSFGVYEWKERKIKV